MTSNTLSWYSCDISTVVFHHDAQVPLQLNERLCYICIFLPVFFTLHLCWGSGVRACTNVASSTDLMFRYFSHDTYRLQHIIIVVIEFDF
jgi:hypothetical protein